MAIVKLGLVLSIEPNGKFEDPELLKEKICEQLKGVEVRRGNLVTVIKDVGVYGEGLSSQWDTKSYDFWHKEKS